MWRPVLACPDTVPTLQSSSVDPGLLSPEEMGGRFEMAPFHPLCLKIADLCLSAFLGYLSSS